MVKGSLWNISDQEDLKLRLSHLRNDSPRHWGTMDVGQMLRHMDIAYKNATGEVTVPKQAMAVVTSLTPVKWLIIKYMPFQRNLPTAKEYKVTASIDFKAAYDTFLNTFNRMVSEHPSIVFSEHPIFGKMSHEMWGTLLYKHLDHHLQQFGA